MTGDEGKLSRRETLTRLASAVLAGGAVLVGARFFHDRRRPAPVSRKVPDWRRHGTPARVVAARGRDGADNVRRVVAALGGMERFISAGERVLIKPNIGWDRVPEQAANTDPQVVAELVVLCLAAGAREVVVTDISCNDPRRCFARSGIAQAAAAAGATVIESHRLRLVPASLAGLARELEVAEALLLADRVINVPVVKHHRLSRVTLGMKNWFGVLGPGRNRLHQSVHRAIAELAATFRPTLTVVDATRVLLANGPQGGSLGDVRRLDAVAAGTDPVLCDAWGAVQLGLRPAELPFLREAEQRGLGHTDVALVQELGSA